MRSVWVSRSTPWFIASVTALTISGRAPSYSARVSPIRTRTCLIAGEEESWPASVSTVTAR
jgi:hypothetical protein